MKQRMQTKMVSATAIVVFIFLTLFFSIEVIYFLTRGKPFHLLWISCLLASILTAWAIVNKVSRATAKKIRWIIFVLIVVSSAIVLRQKDLPLSTLSITINKSDRASTVLLRQFVHGKKQIVLSDIHPDNDPQTIRFKLPGNIQDNNRPLKIYFGHTNANRIYEIRTIAFETHILWLPAPLTAYQGANLIDIAGTEKSINILSLTDNVLRLSSRIHGKPTLNIISDKAIISRSISPNRQVILKAVWFFLCTTCSGLILWGTDIPHYTYSFRKTQLIEQLTQ